MYYNPDENEEELEIPYLVRKYASPVGSPVKPVSVAYGILKFVGIFFLVLLILVALIKYG